jgi:hypothetical protein
LRSSRSTRSRGRPAARFIARRCSSAHIEIVTPANSMSIALARSSAYGKTSSRPWTTSKSPSCVAISARSPPRSSAAQRRAARKACESARSSLRGSQRAAAARLHVAAIALRAPPQGHSMTARVAQTSIQHYRANLPKATRESASRGPCRASYGKPGWVARWLLVWDFGAQLRRNRRRIDDFS